MERITAMERIKTRERVGAVLLILVSLVFVGMGVLIVSVADAGDAWKGWLSIVFFGAGVLVGYRMLAELADEPLASPEEIVTKYRDRFKRTLGGHWCSYLGGGEEMIHGMTMDFHEDGTGKIVTWENTVGVGGTGESQTEETFRWECVGDRSVKLTNEHGEDSVASYDFKVWHTEYDTPLVQLYEPDHWAVELFGEEGFWVSPYRMTQEPEQLGEPLNAADGQAAADS